ncbi:hypothetical protein JD844_023475 [Phrynosoma platyrhinos]|uniref:EGF-like domain-containing protein n=1 Tax=Phrynosoma platyrhinos TaxID=52577 RepID=A0ABQ7SWW3_PHRPL|nr:hypothetical protein JD844_023475 [Phrynosoma platyrhinos]
MYIPVRSCHRRLRKKYGEFSPPKYLNGFEGNIWCNWTVWAGSKKHIVIYIEGFKSDEGCDKNEDKIFFHGVSSFAENMAVYACWGKEMHAFATYAKGVNVVFLMSHRTNPRKEGFVGKYYIFKQQETRLLPKDAIDSEMPAPEPSPGARNSIPQSNKESLLFILANASSIISSNHRINKAMEMNESLQASRKKASVVSLKDFIMKTENLSMVSTSSNGREKPSVIWRMSTEEIPVGLNESTTTPHLSSSDIPYFELAPIKEFYSSLEGTEFPSRMLISTLGSFLEDHLWMSSKSTQVRPRTSYQGQSDVGISLASKTPSRSDNVGFQVQSSHLVDLATQHGLSPSASIATTAHLITAELGLSYITTFSMRQDILSFPGQNLEPLPFHRIRAAHLLAVPNPEVILSDQEYILSPSMTQTHPFASSGSYQTLSVCAVLPTPTLSEQESGIFSIMPPDVSSSVKELRCAYAEEGTILQADTQLEAICPTASLLEPRASENAVETLSAAFLVNEFAPSFGLQTAKDVEIPLISPCYLDVVCTPKQEKGYLVTMLSSTLSVQEMIAPCSSYCADLECLFSAAVQPSIIQTLLGGKGDNDLGTESGEKDKKVLPLNTVKPLYLESKPELCSPLDRFTVSTLFPLHESFTNLPLISVPIMNAEKQSGNTIEHGFISSTAVVSLLSCNEMQTPAMLSPLPLEVVREGRGQTREPPKSWEMQHHAKWQQPSLEFIVADFEVPGTLLEAPSLREGLDWSTIQASKVGLLLNYRESGFPWLLVYFPVKSCHVILKDEAGTFSPPVLSRMQTNNWCNWTIWAGQHKHILVYIEGFEGRPDCEKNQDKIIFQGVSSSVESKVAYACRNHGTLIFAAQAVAVHVVFLSTFSSQNDIHKQFRGRYYVFENYEAASTGAKDPLLKSNSNFGLFSKSYVMHMGHIKDFVKTSRKLSKENWLPVTNKEKLEINESATQLEAFLKSAVGNHMQVSVLKSMENVTVHPFALKRMHVARPSIHDARSENEISSGNLKKILDVRSNILKNEEKSTYNPVFTSNSPHVPLKVKMKTKVVEMKDNGITIESAYHQNTATHWMPIYMSGFGRAVSGTSAFKKGIAFPQVSKEKQRIPVSSPKNMPRTILQSQQSNSGFSRKITDAIQTQQLLELKELKGEKMDNEIYRINSSNSEQYIIFTSAGKNESWRPELLVTEMPPNSTAKTLDHLDVLLAPSVGALNHNIMDAATTLSSHAVLSGNLKSTEVETAVITHSSNSETRYREHPQRKYMKPKPPYPPSGWKLRNSPSLKGENNSYDLLFEITFGIEHKGRLPPIKSDLEKALIESIKKKVQEKVKLFSDKIVEVKLKEVVRRDKTEMDRQNDPNLIFTFWLHLTSEEKNMSHLVHSQLEGLSGISVGVGEVRTVFVRDVNECSAGIGLCGIEAICLNGFGTYLCQCKEEYEDHSLTKSGTLCLRGPRSDIGSLYSYTEILVGTTVFLISVLVVVISVLCAIVKKKRTKKNVHFQEAALPGTPATSQLQQTPFDQNNIHHLLTLDPAQLKLRAKVPEWPLQVRTSPSETYSVSIEQSECL